MKNVKPNKIAYNTLKYQRIDPPSRDSLRAAWNRPVLWPIGVALAALAAFSWPAVVSYRRRERMAAR
jgi:hypothetical protein